MSRLTTGVPPLTVEARDYDSVTLPVDAFEFSPTSKYVGLKTGWGFKTSLLTLSGAASPFYSPVAAETSIGTYHPLNRSVTSFDVAGRSDAITSPYTWDLSGLIPIGTIAVEVFAAILLNSPSEIAANNLFVWNYDMGASPNAVEIANKGLRLDVSSRSATVESQAIRSSGVFNVLIGASRKLYTGMTTGALHVYYLLVRGYWI